MLKKDNGSITVVLGGARKAGAPKDPGAPRHGSLPERPYYDGAFVEREKERTVSKPRIAAILTVALVSAFGAAACGGGGGGGEAQQAGQLQQRVERLEQQVERQQQQLDEQQLVLDQQVRETVKEAEETQP